MSRGSTLESYLTAPPQEELERLLGFSLDPAVYRNIKKAAPNPPVVAAPRAEEPEPDPVATPVEPAPLEPARLVPAAVAPVSEKSVVAEPAPPASLSLGSLTQALQDESPPKPKPPLSPGSPVEPWLGKECEHVAFIWTCMILCFTPFQNCRACVN